ncbi:hypothetical protein RHSIM_Rhsim01G0093700 [Rhododendron simsii]|uniref:PDZ domain-containing protein n=1 Tax=Rhododendron simsii TaxID=118357 RepID=A0A834HJP2_RHOSS|nr:hypothetical protein RHSIM_Rhsim01G0093700 [Rhododendron simsii]
MMPSASNLSKIAGVEFCPNTGDISTIKFDVKEKKFYLPIITLNVHSEVIIRNLIAYEASTVSDSLVFAQYTELLDGIIDTAEDAKLLREKKIIVNRLKSDDAVLQLFDGIGKSVRLTNAPYYDKTIEDVNKFFYNSRRVRIYSGVRKYVFGSWKILTFFAGILLLLLTGNLNKAKAILIYLSKYMEIDSVSPWKRKSRGALKASDMDIDTKGAALKASPSVVSVVSYKGGKMMLPGSGTIIDCEEVNGTYTSTILTSTTLLRSSPESNTLQDDMKVVILVIKVSVYLADGKSFEGHVSAHEFYFNIATISITSDVALPTACLRLLDDSISLYPCNSNYFKLAPGDIVVAIGRSCDKTHELKVTPGKFRESCQPCLGMELTNLYAASIGKLEKVISKFSTSKGVLVDEVIKGSPAEKAGILYRDVIVQCGKKEVQSFLEETVEVDVIRESSAARLILKVFVDETSSDKVNSWPVPKTYEASVKRIQHGMMINVMSTGFCF